jgi:hypothetical protein
LFGKPIIPSSLFRGYKNFERKLWPHFFGSAPVVGAIAIGKRYAALEGSNQIDFWCSQSVEGKARQLSAAIMCQNSVQRVSVHSLSRYALSSDKK